VRDVRAAARRPPRGAARSWSLERTAVIVEDANKPGKSDDLTALDAIVEHANELTRQSCQPGSCNPPLTRDAPPPPAVRHFVRIARQLVLGSLNALICR
jgi:hypothetical protein